MSQPIKKTYVVEWAGPFSKNEIDEIIDKRKSGCMYIVTGLARYMRGCATLQYIGISKRGAAVRLHDKGHKSSLVSRECQFWLGHFSNINQEASRSNLELAEHALIYCCDPVQNVVKRRSAPKQPVVVVNRWKTKDDRYRERRSYPAQKEIPDVIIYDGEEFWFCEKLKKVTWE